MQFVDYEHLRGEVLTTRHCTNLRLPLPVPGNENCYVANCWTYFTRNFLRLKNAESLMEAVMLF